MQALLLKCGGRDWERQAEEGRLRQKAVSEALVRMTGEAESVTLTRMSIGEDEEALGRLAEKLRTNSHLKLLQLDGNGITGAASKALATALKVNDVLRALDLDCNQIGDEGAASFADALVVNSTLRNLELHNNDIGSVGVGKLAQALRANKSLRSLNLANNRIDDLGATCLANALSGASSIVDLSLAGNLIGDSGATELGRMLGINSVLRELHLEQNAIGDEGASAIAQALFENSALRELFLLDNPFGVPGALALSKTLGANKGITRLALTIDRRQPGADVAMNNLRNHLYLRQAIQRIEIGTAERVSLKGVVVGDEGARRLAGVVAGSKLLQQLNLEKCGIGDAGATCLAEGLAANESLVAISLGFNNISDEAALSLARLLRNGVALQHVLLEGNPGYTTFALELLEVTDVVDAALAAIEEGERRIAIFDKAIGDAGASRLAQCLHRCSHLCELRLERCGVGNAGALEFSKALEAVEGTCGLEVLDLRGNGITNEGADRLIELAQEGALRRRLDLRDNDVSADRLALLEQMRPGPAEALAALDIGAALPEEPVDMKRNSTVELSPTADIGNFEADEDLRWDPVECANTQQDCIGSL